MATTEVPGGCFRCNYGDFRDRIEELQRDARPDVLFAESVGSCVDLVGPVLTPLAALTGSASMHVTYSVFVDGRLLRRRLLGLSMPFSVMPTPLDLDYGPYVAGSSELAWLDERLTFVPSDGCRRRTTLEVVRALLESLRRTPDPLAHVKVLITAGSVVAKVSFTSLEEPGWEASVPDLPAGPVALLVNARIQAEVVSLRERVTQALVQALRDAGVDYDIGGVTAFDPRVPEP